MDLRFEYLETIDSTNDEIKRRAEKGAGEGLVISAGTQTRGKGRSGHHWDSPLKSSVSTSILLKPDMSVPEASRVTLVAALAVAKALNSLYGLDAGIKWPNDIVIGKRKICGILSEMLPQENRVKYAVVGIGINVHQTLFPDEISDMATSIDLELKGRKSSRKAITEAVWKCFSQYYSIFTENKSLEGLTDLYNKLCVNNNKIVRVMDPAGEYTGRCLGINEAGALLVRNNEEINEIISGEVHVRGLYGYI